MTYSEEEWLASLRQCFEEYGKVTPEIFNSDDRFPSYTGAAKRFGSWTRAKELAGVADAETIECDTCGERFAHIGKHWNNSVCRWPHLTSRQMAIVTGVLMGDGTLLRDGTDCCVGIEMTNREYLEWLDHRLGVFSTGVKLKHTPSEQLKRAEDSPLEQIRSAKTLKPSYLLLTRRSPQFNRFRTWYDTGEKRYPAHLSLNPNVVRHWYCCDGTLNIREKAKNPRASLICTNERDRPGFILDLFQQVGFEPTEQNGTFVFDVEETARLLDWMGGPPPGFEYKWATSYDTYQELKPGS